MKYCQTTIIMSCLEVNFERFYYANLNSKDLLLFTPANMSGCTYSDILSYEDSKHVCIR